jgi:hypothetical protein
MATLKIFRETALPGTLQPYAIYLIAPASDPTLLEVVVTNADASASRHVIDKSDIQAMIDASMASAGANDLVIVADIAARDALTPDGNLYAYVTDATGDATVTSGGATYLYNHATTTWIKVSEAESMDVVLQWTNIQGGPASSPANIDDAVTKRHAHANKTQLDQLGDAGGELTYNGVQVKTEYSSTAW